MDSQHRLSIAIVFHRIGPYHLARLKALSNCADVYVIQGVRKDSTYRWDIVDLQESLIVFTLYEDDRALNIGSVNEILEKTHRILQRNKPDVLAVNGWGSTLALSALICGKILRLPIVLMSESNAFDFKRSWFKETIKSKIIKQADSALVGGNTQTEYLIHLGFPKENIYSGYDVVDNDHFSKDHFFNSGSRNIQKNSLLSGPYIFCCCRFIEKKNLEFVIKGYAQYRMTVSGSYMRLVIAGEGPLGERLRQIVNELGLDDDVIFPGFLQYGELPEYFLNARLFILASTSEQWGLVVNEAMASSLPVLISKKCGCVDDLVQEGVNGFSFDPLDVKGFSKLLLRMASDPAKLVEMGYESKRIIDKWTPSTFADSMLTAAKIANLSNRKPLSFLDKIILRSIVTFMRLNPSSSDT